MNNTRTPMLEPDFVDDLIDALLGTDYDLGIGLTEIDGSERPGDWDEDHIETVCRQLARHGVTQDDMSGYWSQDE